MAMVKIISNPYQKRITYQKRTNADSPWVDVNAETSRYSDLLKKDLTGGFFPFVVKDIVEAIIKEYGVDGVPLEIVFEGSRDEFDELNLVCQQDAFQGIVLPTCSEVFLENARDILPRVKKLFADMSPLIDNSMEDDPESIERDKERFSDASSDVVPICVLGNYSAGKSTFINALIGSEILPSGTEPVTAKIYKISRSQFEDRANVKCTYNGAQIDVEFKGTEISTAGVCLDNDFSAGLKKVLEQMCGESISAKVYSVLSYINSFEEESEKPLVEDLIEVEIPFVKGVLANTRHPFVIFDTPGSNSASNARHLTVLKDAMANMTNGLPIFLSTPDALDSTDNENLYRIIREMEELDSRFTMIVVNKADGPGLQRQEKGIEDQERILSQAVPRNLYSGGLFYVSSIIGLGAKNGGRFLDEYYAETFDDQIRKYQNPQDKRYKQLYRWNIMPLQIKAIANAQAEQEQDLAYANSGLLSVEKEIENFAGKYSAYNKCFQSQLFLRRVIGVTHEHLEDAKNESESLRETINKSLEREKQELLGQVNTTALENQRRYDEVYPQHIRDALSQGEITYSSGDLQKKLDEFMDQCETERHFDEGQAALRSTRESIGAHLKEALMSEDGRIDFRALGEAARGFKEDVSATREKAMEQHELRLLIEKEAADMLMKDLSADFDGKLETIRRRIDTESQQYWTQKAEELKKDLVAIVTQSQALTEQKREELSTIIITYREITFDKIPVEEIFIKEDFERVFALNGFTFKQTVKTKKLSNTYNQHLRDAVNGRFDTIIRNHGESAHNWIQSLLGVITANVVDYNPTLSKYAQQIKKLNKQIEEYGRRQIQLGNYSELLSSMMDWKRI